MGGEMRKQQLGCTLRSLFGGEMADAWQNLKLVRCSDELGRAFRCHPADRVIGIAPDEECRHPDYAKWSPDRSARSIPGQSCLHGLTTAEHGNMSIDGFRRNTVRFQPLAQPADVVGENSFSCIWLQEPPVMRRA